MTHFTHQHAQITGSLTNLCVCTRVMIELMCATVIKLAIIR